MTRRLLLALALALCAGAAQAGASLFTRDSLAQITATRAGTPFVLVLWSVDCPPCLKELQLIGTLRDPTERTRVVLVSTDPPDRHAEAAALITRFGLDDIAHWAFGADAAERLRWQIDPQWFGELPRSYGYAADGKRRAHSGLLPPETLKAWLRPEN